jgi:capsular exopolysaccharide synthesis family protein
MSRVDDAVTRAAQLDPAGETARDAETPRPLVPAEALWEPEEEGAASPLVPAPVPAPDRSFSGEPVDAGTPGDEKLVTRWGDPQSIEQYRRLAARLHLRQLERGIKVVMVGSALPGEGKTLTAANLALTLSHSYRRRVLLIDGDLRRPWLHHLFGVPNVAGLNDGLTSQTKHKIPLIHWSDHLTLVTAGRPAADPISVLSSDRMKEVVAEAAETFDWVIIDTPPIGLLTDAKLLSSLVETVILVVEAGRTPFYDIEKAVNAIGRENIFGVVLNRARHTAKSYYNDYYHAHSLKAAD